MLIVMLNKKPMNTLTKISKWVSFTILLLSSAWIAFHAYMTNGFSELLPKDIVELSKNVSVATISVIDSWPYLLFLSLVYLTSAVFIAKNIKAPALFYVAIAISSFMCAFIINILVVSAGFEITKL